MTFPLFGIALVALLVAVHMFSGKMRFLDRIPRSRWLSAAGGSSVAYVFVHLLPELAHAQDVVSEWVMDGPVAAIETHVYLLALIGLTVFYCLEQVMSSSAARQDMRDSSRLFWMHLGFFAVYSLIIGYLLVQGEERTPAALVTYGIAMALHMLVVDVGLRHDHGALYHDRGRWVLAAMPVIGAALGLVMDISELAILSMVAFLGGGVILNVLKEELPEDRQSSFGAFLAGAGGYTVLLLAT
ncbi:MAG: hypothetical protein WA979_07715 [Pacificimonas sp.]